MVGASTALSILASIKNADTLQPFWFMNPFFSIKLFLTILAFGFDIKFTRSAPPPSRAKKSASVCFRILFCAMAVNGWYSDISTFINIDWKGIEPTVIDQMLAAIVVWLLSSNTVSAVAVWYGVWSQRPNRLFPGLKPKYPNVAGVPIFPGTASWLAWDKHVYLYILLPYAVPFGILTCRDYVKIANYFMCQLIGCCCFCKAAVCCCMWFVITCLTIFLWQYAHDQLDYYYWDNAIWAIVMFIAIGSWNFACVFGISYVYGLQVGASKQIMSDYLAELFSKSLIGYSTSEDASTREDIWQGLRAYQDFTDFEEERTSPTNGECLLDDADPCQATVGTAKFHLFYNTLDQMLDTLVMWTILLLVYIRWYEGQGFVDAFAETLAERHIRNYLSYLFSVGTASFTKAVDEYWRTM